MKAPADNMLKTIKNLSDPEVDHVWADEAERRYKKFREGKLKAVEYKQIKKRYRVH